MHVFPIHFLMITHAMYFGDGSKTKAKIIYRITSDLGDGGKRHSNLLVLCSQDINTYWIKVDLGNEGNHHSNSFAVIDIVIPKEFYQSSFFRSSPEIEKPPGNNCKAYKRDRVLKHELCAQGPVEESCI